MVTLGTIRDCLEGAVPSTVATCAPDGTPNVTYVSQVHFVDPTHVALSYQFFNKTRQNVLENPRATALIIHPTTAAQYRLELTYIRTETSGPLFERMKAKLAGIASHTGMSDVFRLRGSDIYRVLKIDTVSGRRSLPAASASSLLAGVRACVERLHGISDLAVLLDEALAGLETHCGIEYAMVLMLDRPGRKLYTVASRGYQQSGVGSEIPLGCGVIGVAAEHRTPIRISYMTAEYSYGRAIRESLRDDGFDLELETLIPLPGMAEPGSQLAVPILWGDRLLGALYVESASDLRFGYDHEDALVTLAVYLATAITALSREADAREIPAGPVQQPPLTNGPAFRVRHYAVDDSVFINDDYLIKGVAGAIFAKLLREHQANGRIEFCNRELRLDPSLRLPDVTDNLEARLILLEKRLLERRAPMRIEKTGRGRFRLRLDRPFGLTEV